MLDLIQADWPAPVGVRAFTTTRIGGVSTGKYASLNLGVHVGDTPTAVTTNRTRVRDLCRMPNEPIWLQQVHGITVLDAASAAIGSTADGSFACRSGAICAILTADCLPIFLCNRTGTEVALLHAGWRGLANGIVEAGLSALHSSPNELLVWLGPAIGAGAYEVGNEVRQAFIAAHPAAVEAFRPSRVADKWLMDIYELARVRLRHNGVTSISGGTFCTATQSDMFFSYRREGVTGRMGSFIWLE